MVPNPPPPSVCFNAPQSVPVANATCVLGTVESPLFWYRVTCESQSLTSPFKVEAYTDPCSSAPVSTKTGSNPVICLDVDSIGHTFSVQVDCKTNGAGSLAPSRVLTPVSVLVGAMLVLVRAIL